MLAEPQTINILLVDDRPENITALEAVLGSNPATLVRAGSGEEALRCVLRDDFAVILLDVFMPGLDGLETAALIRQRQRSHDTPIIFVTAAGRDQDLVSRGYALGAVDYILKPIDPEILRCKVAVFVDLFRKREMVNRQAEELAALNEDLEERVAARTAELEGTVKENVRLYEEARDAVRIREEFLSIASHELRTPLTSLHLALQTLELAARKGALASLPPARIITMLETAERQSRRLTRLIDDLLDVSRITSGKLQLNLQDVDLTAIVAEVVSRFSDELQRAGCTVTINAGSTVQGIWDHSRLEQVITNLLANAMKYGQGKPIVVTVSADDSQAQLIIQDHGIGIAPEHLSRIFGRFERAVSADDYGGLGLGLYIVSQIVEALGGSITASSTPEAGATFTVTLPLQQAHVDILQAAKAPSVL